MKVLFDFQCFEQIYGGVSKYYVETLKHLPPSINYKISVLLSQNSYIKELKPKRIILNFTTTNKTLKLIYRIINELYTIFSMLRYKYDIIHLTFDQDYLLKIFPKYNYVITIHDMIPELFYKKKGYEFINASWIKRRRKLIQIAKYIITVSENTKKDLITFYPDLDTRRIVTIYHGNNKINFSQNYKPSFHIPTNYILYVGNRNLYKNFINFVKGVSNILKENPSINVFCVGKDFIDEELQLFNENGFATQFTCMTVNDIDLMYLYSNASLFVFPSIYEGFGFPILEAWSNECPIVLSNTSCFPEIAKDAAIYFNPLDIKDIEMKIRIGLTNESLRNEITRKGKEYLKSFTWEESATKLSQVYQKIVKE